MHDLQATSSSLDFLIPPPPTISVANASDGYFIITKQCRGFSLQARKIGCPISVPAERSLLAIIAVPEDTRLGASCLVMLQLYRHIRTAFYYGHGGKRQDGTGE